MIVHQMSSNEASAPRGYLSSFFAWNRKFRANLERVLPQPFLVNLHRRYETVVAERINNRTGQVIIDIGGGKMCPYQRFITEPDRQTIISIDNSEEELAQNHDVSFRVVSDVVRSIPLKEMSVDLLSSRSVLEHLDDVGKYLRNCSEILKEDGLLIHSLPCKFAPFALINQILPNRVAQGILYYFQPQWEQECGFKAYYNHCYYSGIKSLLEENGFEMVSVEFRYYQAIYFDFFVPLYLWFLAYDLLISTLGIKNLSCQMLFVARKRKTVG
jgi:ubiquinone/menaquinone biosynthesis C-methylase UbiE